MPIAQNDFESIIEETRNQEKGIPSAPVFVLDESWRISYISPEAARVTDLCAEDVLGKDCRSVFQGSLRESCTHHGQIEAGHVIYDLPLLLHTESGNGKKMINVTALPFFRKEGAFAGCVVYLRDPTRDPQVTELILDSIADGVFTVNKDWQITAFNKAAEMITGWRSGEAIGHFCCEVFQSSVCGEECILAQSVDTRLPIVNRSIFIKRKDGRNVPVSISAAPLIDADGKVIGGVETFRDMTAHLQFSLILDSIADGVFTVNKDWVITSFNKAAEAVTGYTEKQAIGKRCHEIFKSSICGEGCAIGQSMKSGKPVSNRSIYIERADGKRLPVSISAAPILDQNGQVIGGVETFRDLTVVTALRKQITKRFTLADIVSKSASMQKIFEILPNVARSDSNVIILGESGTGKELIARAIHGFSPRMKGPFVAVNCGAIPDTLLESELFGYKAGAFTDAKRDRPGRIKAAEKGTLFLDEIGDISPALQVKLLRFLQDKVYESLGSTQSVHADVRVLAATNRDLKTLVQQDKFREDLFYRLNVVKIELPPLRERKEDVPLLVDHFIEKLNIQQGRDIKAISDEALALLMRYDFPGNIRELENIMEYSFIMCHEDVILPQHLPEQFGEVKKKSQEICTFPDMPMTLEEIEKAAILRTLERNNWRKMATCRELGISKDTLRRKIVRYGITVPEKFEAEV